MFSAEHNSPFRQLPPEIFGCIFDFLGFGDKKTMRMVCRRWGCICDDQTKFKFNPVVNGNDSVKNLLSTGVAIENITFKNVTEANWPFTRNQFPRVRTVTLDNGNSDDAILPFFNRFGRENLEGLHLKEHSFLNFGIRKMTHVFRNTEWENLSELNFRLNHKRANRLVYAIDHETPEDFTKFGSALVLFLKLAKAPKLRKLVLEYNEMKSVLGREEMFKPFYNAFVGFLGRHSETLKVLDWAIRSTRNFESDLHGWTVSSELQEIINRDLKLESFSTEFCRREYRCQMIPGPTLVFPCVWGFTGLKTFSCRIEEKLQFAFGWWESVRHLQFNAECVVNKIQDTMQSNVQTLESVSIPLTSMIQLNNLNNCPNLKKLTLETYSVTFNDLDLTLNLRLPTVTHLELQAFPSTNARLPLTFDTWITTVFRDLESIKIELNFFPRWYDLPSRYNWTLSVQMLQNLLQLSRLKTIEEVQRSQIHGQRWFDQQVKWFCTSSINPVLKYQMTRAYDHGFASTCPWLTSVAITVIRP